MIKNLVTNGCSFTIGDWIPPYHNSWPWMLHQRLGTETLHNWAWAGAGNHYIARSTQDQIEALALDPRDTVVMIMWSGMDRQDRRVTGEYWHLLPDYLSRRRFRDQADGHWVFSGGRGGTWQDYAETRRLFEPYYVTTDPEIWAQETLEHMEDLRLWLEQRGFPWIYMSYVDLFRPEPNASAPGTLSLAYFSQHLIRPSVDWHHGWIWHGERDSVYDFARQRGLMSRDGFHPATEAYQQWVDEVMMPQLESLGITR